MLIQIDHRNLQSHIAQSLIVHVQKIAARTPLAPEDARVREWAEDTARNIVQGLTLDDSDDGPITGEPIMEGKMQP